MAKRLKFNWKALYDDLTARLVDVTNELIDEVYRESIKKLSAKGQADVEKKSAIYQKTKHMIKANCIYYAQAIVESFGIGDKADSSSESYWNEYQQKSPFWNSARTSKTIVGRPAKPNPYINMWGEKQHTTGTKEGIPTGNKGFYGNRAIQTVEAWIIQDGQTRVERRISVEIDKFFQQDLSKYFTMVGK